MRKQWTEAKVREEATEIAQQLGHFPSSTYLKEIGRNDLSCQIVRKGGFMKLAAELGFAREHSDSDTGWMGELEVIGTLKLRGFEVERADDLRSPYDMIADGCVRIDVKSASYAEYGPCRGWFYRIGKHVQADIVILHQLDEQQDYVFHWWEVTASNMTIARGGGKYCADRGAYSKIEHVRNSVRALRAA